MSVRLERERQASDWRDLMDPISLIIAAVTAGATAAVQETAGAAIRDAYAGLKRLLGRRLAGDPDAEAELAAIERQPDADPQPLAKRLHTAGAERDEELLKAARALLERLDPEGARAGKYDVRVSGGKGVVVGDQANVTMTFNNGD
jgi:hypothetical protein